MFEAVKLNRMTVQRPAANTSKDAEIKLSEILSKWSYSSLAIDETTDIISSAQMCTVSRGVTSNFGVYEELVHLHSMRWITLHSGITTQSSEAKRNSAKHREGVLGEWRYSSTH
jgi:hypothetical protein